MKHDVDRDWSGPSRNAERPALLVIGVAAVVLAVAIGCIACNTVGLVAREGALRAWYLPLGLLLGVLRVGARRNTRRPLSLALFLLGIGALTARAYDAQGAEAVGVHPAASSEPPQF